MGEPVNIREDVYARLLDLTHLIPSISPWSVWDLPWSLWLGYAAMVDGWREAQREAARKHG